uniref:Uncharacterized protein n=1 Tax=Clytia hemisphaerica TaxID=252671 RepID=A0A7M5V7T8_9CNID
KKHDIEEHLYYGDTLTHIQNLLGDGRTTRFLSETYEDDFTPRETWTKMITFLTKERRIAEQKLILRDDSSKSNDNNKPKDSSKNTKDTRYGHPNSYVSDTSNPLCALCETPAGVDHHVATSGPGQTRLIQYYTCQLFAEMTPASRLSLLKSKWYCFQCLFPGAASASGKHKDGKCQHDFVCPDESHQKYSVRKHVLVCEEHKEEPANVELLEQFKERFFRNPDLPSFTKNISLSFHTESFQTVDEDGDRGIYMLQEIQINQNKLLIFFDNGCSDFVVSQKAIKLLGSNAIKASSKPVILGGVGNSITKSTLGRYIVKLPLSNGGMVSFTGPCIPKITSTFPTFSLIEAHKDIDESYSKAGGLKSLPKLPRLIGGDVHMMIGVKHLKYFPKHVYQMPSGLTILESLFTSSSGGRGVIAGPHPSFSCFNVSSNFTSVYHNTIHPIKTPLLGFNADHPTSLKYFTQSKEDQSNQSININDQKEHPIDSPIEISSK